MEGVKIMKKKERYVRPFIVVITEDTECHLLAGSPPPSDVNSGVAGLRDPTTGTNCGSRTSGSSTGEATGHSGIGTKFAKGWTPVGMDVLDSL